MRVATSWFAVLYSFEVTRSAPRKPAREIQGLSPGATGPVPGAWWLGRVVQIGAGKVFGDASFVVATAFALGDRFRSGGIGAHPVSRLRSCAGEVIGYSTHGWRLAKRDEEAVA